jgi:4-carboxymuconolactone decarboxylase
MKNTIELRAILQRDGAIFLLREPDGRWALPGGRLDDDADDIDAAMDSFLRASGVAVADIAEDFLHTDYVTSMDGQLVLNFYAPAEWHGEPAHPQGHHAWFGHGDIAAIAMDEVVQRGLLRILSGEPPEETMDFEDLADMIPGGSARPPSRHERGLDVLRTLGAATDPAAAYAAMAARQPEIAPDVVDFALGEVWSHPALDRKTRSLLVVCMLSALGGRTGPLRSHINGALNHGASVEEITQAMRMVAVYAGFPAALEAWTVMEDVFRARGITRGGPA